MLKGRSVGDAAAYAHALLPLFEVVLEPLESGALNANTVFKGVEE